MSQTLGKLFPKPVYISEPKQYSFEADKLMAQLNSLCILMYIGNPFFIRLTQYLTSVLVARLF